MSVYIDIMGSRDEIDMSYPFCGGNSQCIFLYTETTHLANLLYKVQIGPVVALICLFLAKFMIEVKVATRQHKVTAFVG